MPVTLDTQRLRFARVPLVAALAAIGIAVAPPLARAGGPERAPVKAPSRIGPEPAPTARTSATTTATTTSSAQTSTIAPPPATSARPLIVSTASAPAPQRPATSAQPKPHTRQPAPPRATHAVKAAARALARGTATRLAIAAVPAGTDDSNRLLFLGGIALLVFVLGDAAFLAVSARVIREGS